MLRRTQTGLLAGLLLVSSAAGLGACDDVVPTFRNRQQSDVFVQEVRRKVDILLVVDNSCSMIDEQQKLAANFDNFIAQFLDADVDYQMGVVTTDMTDPTQSGRIVGDTKLITSDMPVDDARDTFQDNVKVCATGSGFERGLLAAEAALSEPLVSTDNAGFLRDDASLSIVFVSDEDDLSPRPVGEYLDFFKGLKGDAGYRDDALVNLSAVVGDPPTGCEQPSPYVPDCADGLDEEDGDGLIDCADDDCASSRWCTLDPAELDCSDGEDNDGDGAADCADADCGGEATCREQDCTDGIDSDHDGAMDCADIDCLVDFPELCGEISCEDGQLSHHGPVAVPDFLLDCADPSCFAVPETEELCQGARAEIDYKDRCELTVVFDPFTGGIIETDGRDVDSTDGLGNELSGCEDPDCATYWLCQGGFASEGYAQCGDCIDNDNDGLEDCEDLDCLESEFCDNPYPIDAGSRYIDVAVRTGGVVTSICAQEFSGLVRELGLNISGLRRIFYLSAWPRLGTLEMRFDDASESSPLITAGWTFEREQNRIVFTEEATPAAGTTVYVTYERATEPPWEQDEPGGAR